MDIAPAVVAVVDDDTFVMNSVRRWLRMRDAPSVGCGDADALLRTLVPGPRGWMVQPTADGAAGPLRAAIIDLNLPGDINGLELAERLLQGDPSLRVVLITAALWQEDPQLDKLPPGLHCLSKPFRLEEIEALVFGGPEAPS